MEIAASRLAKDYDFEFKTASKRCTHCDAKLGDEKDAGDDVEGLCKECEGQELGDPKESSTKTAEKSDFEPANEGDLGDSRPAPSIDGDELDSAITGGDSNADLKDSKGRPLQKGESYLLKTPDYAVPDKVVIDHIKGDVVTFTIKTDAIDYQTDISTDEIASRKYEFEPVKGDTPGEFAPLPSDEEVADIEPDVEIDTEAEIHRAASADYCGRCGHSKAEHGDDGNGEACGTFTTEDDDYDPDWESKSASVRADDLFWDAIGREVDVAKTAGTVTPLALREIMDEGEGVIARNAGKMSLEGTHYLQMSDDEIADIFS
jgi:hypothetical protein